MYNKILIQYYAVYHARPLPKKEEETKWEGKIYNQITTKSQQSNTTKQSKHKQTKERITKNKHTIKAHKTKTQQNKNIKTQ